MLNKFTFRQVLIDHREVPTEDMKISVEIPPANIDEFYALIKRVALAFGFQPDSIDGAILEQAEEIKRDETS